MKWFEVAALVVAALLGSGGLAALATARAVNRRTLSEAKKAEQDADRADAEARKLVSETMLTLLKPAKDRADALEQELKESQQMVALLRAELQTMRNEVDRMTKEMASLQDENDRLRGA